MKILLAFMLLVHSQGCNRQPPAENQGKTLLAVATNSRGELWTTNIVDTGTNIFTFSVTNSSAFSRMFLLSTNQNASHLRQSSVTFLDSSTRNWWLQIVPFSKANYMDCWSRSNVTVLSRHQPIIEGFTNGLWIIKFKDNANPPKPDAPIGRKAGDYASWKGWKVFSDEFGIKDKAFDPDMELKEMHYHRVVIMNPNGNVFTMMFTYDDSEDGGNTYGWISDYWDGSKVALIEDGDIVEANK